MQATTANGRRMYKKINKPVKITRSPDRVTAIETSMFSKYVQAIAVFAKREGLPVILFCTSDKRERANVKILRNAGLKTLYNNKAHHSLDIGFESYVTKVDYIENLKDLLCYDQKNTAEYILIVEDINAIIIHAMSRSLQAAGEKYENLMWFMRSAGTVYAIGDSMKREELIVLNDAISRSIQSKVAFIRDHTENTAIFLEYEAMLAEVRHEIIHGRAFTMSCATKGQAECMMQVCREVPGCKTSKVKLNAEDPSEDEWKYAGLRYNPKHTEGHARTLFIFVDEKGKASPEKIVQKISATANIQRVCICMC